MGFLTKLLGVPQDVQEAIEEKKSLQQLLKAERRVNEELREEIADAEHNTYRYHQQDIREANEQVEDAEYRADRKVVVAGYKANDATADAKREARDEFQAKLDKSDAKIAELESTIRTLELEAEESQQDTDLAIQEGILEFREAHVEDVAKLQVKVATLEGEVKAAQADGKSKDQVIKILTDLLEDYGETNSQLVETISEVAPKINLEKIGFEVTVPVPAKQGGGEQKKDGNK